MKNSIKRSLSLKYLLKLDVIQFDVIQFYNNYTLIRLHNSQSVSSLYSFYMNNQTPFQIEFFKYQTIVPFETQYPKDFAKSNDLRLLIQIFSRSYLRMFTDSKTNNLHFICKQKGAGCFDLEAYLTLDGHGFYFMEDIKKHKHKNKCEQDGNYFRYLQIYNLIKLKKNMIQEFMRKNELMKEPPSVILTKLSPDKDSYFFESYINGQQELKRKLRKRFDNVVNIDIKKIGKGEDRDQQEIVQIIPKKNKQKVVVSKKKAKKEVQQLFSEDQSSEKNVKNQPKQKKITKMQARNLCRKKIQTKQVKQKQNEKAVVEQPNQMRDYVLILRQGVEPQKEEVIIQPQASLPALDVLNQQAIYDWNSSSGEDSSEKECIEQQPNQTLNFRKQDYFKSLTSSTLNKSLQRQSLIHLIFSKQNYQIQRDNT